MEMKGLKRVSLLEQNNLISFSKAMPYRIQPRRRIQNRALWKVDIFYPMLGIRIDWTICFGPPGYGSVSQWFGSGSFYHQAKMGRKTLISTVLYEFLFLKNDVNVPAKKLFVGILKITDKNSRIWISQRYESADPDPYHYQYITDP
jgi:hypothetical protein